MMKLFLGMMKLFHRELDPHKWRWDREKGRAVFFVDNGLGPGLAAGIAYAAIMAIMGSEISVYINAAIFAAITTPIYFFIAYVIWETNEDAFAAWVAEEGKRILAAREAAGENLMQSPKVR